MIITCDLGALLLMVGICRRLGDTTFPVLAYGWCPLVVKELAGSAHIDGTLVFLLLFGIWSLLGSRRATSGLWLAAAALVKPTPLVLAPAFLKRIGWYGILPAAAAVGVIGLALPEGMKAYAADWYFNGAFTRFLPDGRTFALALPMLAVGTVALVWFLKDDGSPGDLIR
ncbi:MAG: hypothetical protein GY953_09515, partial [bacterium]|nr:hypothetical protein [bacterium]